MVISIIIPTYNEEQLVESTISHFSKLDIPHEIIISDTRSTDNTVAIAKRLADKVAVLPAEKSRGVSRGRNNGAALAEGTYMVFMDCGTVIKHPTAFFRRAIAAFESQPGLVGISCRVEVYKEVETMSDAAVSFLMNLWFLFLNNVCRVGIASGKFIMVRTDMFRKTTGFNENLITAEDIDFFGRLAKLGRTRILWNLAVYHAGRRFHQKGAWRTLFLWIKNAASFWLFKKPDDTWEPVR